MEHSFLKPDMNYGKPVKLAVSSWCCGNEYQQKLNLTQQCPVTSVHKKGMHLASSFLSSGQAAMAAGTFPLLPQALSASLGAAQACGERRLQ